MEIIEARRAVPFPFTNASGMLFAGISNSGKSYMVKQILRHRDVVFEQKPERVLYIYGIWGKYLEELEADGCILCEGLPDVNEILKFARQYTNAIIVIDDCMTALSTCTYTADLFTKICHHTSCTIMILLQSLFPPGRDMRTLTMNANYVFLFKSPRSLQQASEFGRQIGLYKTVRSAFLDIMAQDGYKYLLIDMTMMCPHKHRVRTGCLPGDEIVLYR